MKTEKSTLVEVVLFSIFSFIIPLFGLVFGVLLLMKVNKQKRQSWVKIIAIVAIVTQLSLITIYSLGIINFNNTETKITEYHEIIDN